MKRRGLLIVIISILLVFPLSAMAEEYRENPSLYSFGEIMQKLPKMWLANPIEMMEMMKDYPDYECWRSYDIIGCRSVNNRYSAEMFVNFQFSSEDDYAEFSHAVLSTMVNGTEGVQKVIETLWIDGLEPANISGAKYPDDQVTLYFSTEDTMMKYNISFGTEGVWLVTVDMGLIRG